MKVQKGKKRNFYDILIQDKQFTLCNAFTTESINISKCIVHFNCIHFIFVQSSSKWQYAAIDVWESATYFCKVKLIDVSVKTAPLYFLTHCNCSTFESDFKVKFCKQLMDGRILGDLSRHNAHSNPQLHHRKISDEKQPVSPRNLFSILESLINRTTPTSFLWQISKYNERIY